MSEKLKLTMRDAPELHRGLDMLVQRYKKELDVEMSVRLGRMIRQLRAEAELFQEQRNQLVARHGEPDPDPEQHGRLIVWPGTRAELAFMADEKTLREAPCKAKVEQFTVAELGLERIDADIVVLILPLLAEGDAGEAD